VYRVKLTEFEGPLDLLLFFIKRDELDITNIPISRITQEFLEYLHLMASLDLEVAGDFIVMAATLMQIKVRMLLPRDENATEEEDPRAELVRRLLEYQRFKEAALRLDAFPQLGRDAFLRPPGPMLYDGPVDLPVEDVKTSLNLEEIEVFELIRALDQMLKKQQKLVIHEVMVERLSVGARINELVDYMMQVRERGATFVELVDHFGGRTRRNVVVTFLSVLEMTRLRLLRIAQLEGGGLEVHPVLENLRGDEGEGLTKALATVDDYDPHGDKQSPPGSSEAAP